MIKVGKWIAKHKILIIILGIILLIPAYLGMAATKINYDVLSYLPDTLETVEGQDIMVDQFGMGAFSMIVVEDMELKDVAALKEKVEAVDHVKKVLWYDSVLDVSVPVEMLPKDLREAFFNGNATMMIALFDNTTSSETSMDAVTEIRKITSKDCFVSGMTGIVTDIKQIALKEMPIYVVIASCLSLVVLLLAMDSLVVPVLFLLCIGVAVLYNLGSNIFLGQISYITQALTAVLQLGVTMDYSIFLLNSYEENKKRFEGDKERAMAHAINATFKSVIGSSITTVAGFIALCFMTFSLGLDMGVVMAKGVVFGVLSTIFILPSLLMFFDKPIEKYTHKTIIHELKHQPLFVTKHYKKILIVFILVFIPFIYAQSHTTQYYDLISGMPEDFASIIGTNQLKDKFDMTTTHFVIVDDSLTTSQIQEMSNEIKGLDGIHNIISYEEFVGPGIPDSFKPSIVKEVCQSDDHKLLVVNSDYKSATTELDNQLDQMDKIIHKYDPNALIGGEGSMTRDLINTTNVDFAFVNVLSVVLIFLIVALTFKSFALPVILVLTIEFAISINMGIPFFTKTTLPFIASMVIGTIQLGATVDYAILLTTRFREELEAGNDLKEAARIATKRSSISIMTSGFSFFAACIGVSFFAKMDLIKSLVVLLARGALISVISILFVLPSLLIFFHKFIEKTTKGWPKERKVEL